MRNLHFSKGNISHDFGQRVEVFSSIVFMKNRWIADVLDRKTFKIDKKPLKGIKTSVPLKHKIRILEKG